MAGIVERPKKGGTSTFQARWRQDGRVQTENFGEGSADKTFKGLVEAHGNRWPHGWVRGEGFVDEPKIPGDMPFVDYAVRYVNRLTGIDERTREDYLREVRIHLSLLTHTDAARREHPATICNLTQDDVTDWVRAEEAGERDRDDADGWARRPADPKSIVNRHGLLYCIVQAAIDSEPQLRTANSCKRTKLPRVDDHTDEEMTFLEREEYQPIAAEIKDPDARDLADWLVGTGMRWGEATAMKVSDLNLVGERPSVSVQRAWKKTKKGAPGVPSTWGRRRPRRPGGRYDSPPRMTAPVDRTEARRLSFPGSDGRRVEARELLQPEVAAGGARLSGEGAAEEAEDS